MKNLLKILVLLVLAWVDADAEITNVVNEVVLDGSKVRTIDSWVSEDDSVSSGGAVVLENAIETNDITSTNLVDAINVESNLVEEIAIEEVAEKSTSPYFNFDRYKIILERKPFGDLDAFALALAADQIKPPVKLPDFAKHYSMCAITDSYGEIMVGFIDKAKRGDVKYYYLRVGETQDGIMLVEADYANESAKLSKDGQEFWIDMMGPKMSNTASSGTSPPFMSRNNSGKSNESYSSRLKKQRESRIKVESRIKYPKENMTKEEIGEHLRKLNMELIRAQGSKGPPLPLQLTPEEDAQLVSEGVLPSAETTEEITQ
jgi:hypothetical protein